MRCDAPVSQNPNSPPFSFGHRLHLLLRLSLPLRSDAPPSSHFPNCGSIPHRILRSSLRQSNPSLQVYISPQIPRESRCRAPIYEAGRNHRSPHQSRCMPGTTFLCCHVEKCLKPRMSELEELGFSPSEISLLFSICPTVFKYTKLKQKVQFWMGIFGSVEKLLRALKTASYLLSLNLDNAVIPNITFLQEQCGLSARQISQVIKLSPRLITSKPEAFKMHVKRAKELGVSYPSSTFVYALVVVGGRNQSIIDSRLCYLKSLELSQEEVTLLITKCPKVLEKTEKNIGQKMEFLLKQAGCNKMMLS